MNIAGLKNITWRKSSDLAFSLLVSIFVVASLAVGIIFPQADSQILNIGDSEGVIATINLISFGLILILFAIVFLFVRLMLLFRETKLIKKHWPDRLTQIEQKIEATRVDFNLVLHDIAKLPKDTIDNWYTIFNRLCEVELILDRAGNSILRERQKQLQSTLNSRFVNFYLKEYPSLILQKNNHLSPYIFPDILKTSADSPLFILVFDGLRLDHWLKIKPYITEKLSNYKLTDESFGISILPTHTPFARNSLFSGMLPDACANEFYHGELKNNQYEEKAFFQLSKQFNKRAFYMRQAENEFQKAIRGIKSERFDVKAFVFMFVDGLAHSMSNTKATEKSFRDHVLVEFKQDEVGAIFDKINEQKGTILLTSDHGSKFVSKASRLQGFQDPRSLGQEDIIPQRYAFGTVFDSSKLPEEFSVISDFANYSLPQKQGSELVIATGDSRLQTRNREFIHEYAHGGISFEEVIVPKIVFESKK